jgi:hypothetical protein
LADRIRIESSSLSRSLQKRRRLSYNKAKEEVEDCHQSAAWIFAPAETLGENTQKRKKKKKMYRER